MALSLAPVLGVNLGSPVSGLRLRRPPSALCPPHTRLTPGTTPLPRQGPTQDQPRGQGSEDHQGWWAGRCGCPAQRLEASKAVPGSLELLGVRRVLGVRAWLLCAAGRLEEGALGLRSCWRSGRAWRWARRGSGSGRLRRPQSAPGRWTTAGPGREGPGGPLSRPGQGGHGPEEPAALPVGADPECLRRALLPGSSPSQQPHPVLCAPGSPRHDRLPSAPQTAPPGKENKGARVGQRRAALPLSSSRRGPRQVGRSQSPGPRQGALGVPLPDEGPRWSQHTKPPRLGTPRPRPQH